MTEEKPSEEVSQKVDTAQEPPNASAITGLPNKTPMFEAIHAARY
jgi:hypothetical protein